LRCFFSQWRKRHSPKGIRIGAVAVPGALRASLQTYGGDKDKGTGNEDRTGDGHEAGTISRGSKLVENEPTIVDKCNVDRVQQIHGDEHQKGGVYLMNPSLPTENKHYDQQSEHKVMPNRPHLPFLPTRRHCHCVAFSTVEIIVILGIGIALFALLAPRLKHNRELAEQSHRSGITATLARIEKAKGLHTTEHHLKKGTPVTAGDLVRCGYLSEYDISVPAAQGIHFIVGAVGQPVSYTFDAKAQSHHNDHE
jgi:hypothetical protein